MWFNLNDDDQALITALCDKIFVTAGDLHTADPLAVNLHALRSRITYFKDEQAGLGAYRSGVETDDDFEVDPDACVSVGDAPGGAWVHTWVWVTNEQAGVEEDEEETV